MRALIGAMLLGAAPCLAQGGGGDSVYSPDRLSVRPAVIAIPVFRYPQGLGTRRPRGRVLVQLIVDTVGRVEPASIAILDSPDSALDSAACAFAAAVLFRPGEVGRRPVRVLVDLPIYVQPPDTSNRPHPMDSVEVKPMRLSGPMPVFPRGALAARRDGVVELEAVVDTLGRVEEGTIRVVDSPGEDFSAAAIAALRGSRYRPARLGNQAVRVVIRQPINFSLPGHCFPIRPVPQLLSRLGDLGPVPDSVRLASEVDSAPALLSHPRVRYPREVREDREASVFVAVVVDTAGGPEPSTVRALGTPDSAFAREAVRVIRAARFSPGRLAGRPVRTILVVPVHFELMCR